MPAKTPVAPVTVNFNLLGDQFPHGWFFNRFRIDRLGDSFLVSLGLLTDTGGVLAVNAFVLGGTDHDNNKDRSLSYIKNFPESAADPKHILGFTAPPARVYPINHINLSRVGLQAEIGLYRFSITTLANAMREGTKHANSKTPAVSCYPVVMFRCDLPVQVSLIKELYSFETV